MISTVDAPVEFEVSIGNYGNKHEEHLIPGVSTTQPTNSVFDGCYYYYLPWSDNKPCLSIDCHWEDVIFRLESMNLLQSIADRLVITTMMMTMTMMMRMRMMMMMMMMMIIIIIIIIIIIVEWPCSGAVVYFACLIFCSFSRVLARIACYNLGHC